MSVSLRARPSRPLRAGWPAALMLAALLGGGARAQIDGLTPAPQLWKWWRIQDENVLVFYSHRTFGDGREEERPRVKAMAEWIVARAREASEELSVRLGRPADSLHFRLSGSTPREYRQRPYYHSKGGGQLYLAPEVFGYELAPMSRREWFQREIREQVAQAILWSHLLAERRSTGLIKRFLFRRLMPTWFLVGMGAHLAGHRTTFEEQLLRASLREDDPLPLSRFRFLESYDVLRKEVAYQQARSFCGWLEQEHGMPRCLQLISARREDPTHPGGAFRRTFGLSLDEARRQWVAAVRARDRAERREAPPPPRARVLETLAAWTGPLAPSPDGASLALGLGHQNPRTRLLDLVLVPRFGDKQPGYLGGDPVLGPPCWLPDGQLLTIQHTLTNYGLRLQRLALMEARPRERDEDGDNLLEDLGKAVDLGERLLGKVLGSEPVSIFETRNMHELGLSPDGRMLTVLAYPDQAAELLLLPLPPADRIDHQTELQVTRRIPVPGAVTRRWMHNHPRILTVRDAGAGAEIRSLDPRTGEEQRVLSWPSPIRAVLGTRERILFVDTVGDSIHRMLEYTPRRDELRVLWRDPDGIYTPALVQDAAWVAYTRAHGDGFQLVEHPLPPPLAAPPLQPAEATGLELPEPGVPPELQGTSEGLAHRRNRVVFGKRRDNAVLDEDALGWTWEWKDGFNHASIEVAGWRGNSAKRQNWELLYFNNEHRPSWFVGAFSADEEDLLGLFPFSNFSSAISQSGGLAGFHLQTTPRQNLVFTAESKQLTYDAAVFAGRIPDSEPRSNTLRVRWVLDDLSHTLGSESTPVGDRWLSLSLARSAFGGDVKLWETLGDWRTFTPLRNQPGTLMTRLAFGIRDFDESPSPVPLDFSLGGPESLRGVRPNVLVGENFITGTVEYRRLLREGSDLRRALRKLKLGNLLQPFESDRVYALAFYDMGTAYNGPFEWGRFERSVGVEIRAEGFLTSLRQVNFRIGFAHGLGDLGENDFYVVTSSLF